MGLDELRLDEWAQSRESRAVVEEIVSIDMPKTGKSFNECFFEISPPGTMDTPSRFRDAPPSPVSVIGIIDLTKEDDAQEAAPKLARAASRQVFRPVPLRLNSPKANTNGFVELRPPANQVQQALQQSASGDGGESDSSEYIDGDSNEDAWWREWLGYSEAGSWVVCPQGKKRRNN